MPGTNPAQVSSPNDCSRPPGSESCHWLKSPITRTSDARGAQARKLVPPGTSVAPRGIDFGFAGRVAIVRFYTERHNFFHRPESGGGDGSSPGPLASVEIARGRAVPAPDVLATLLSIKPLV